jgi:hypothetical protein
LPKAVKIMDIAFLLRLFGGMNESEVVTLKDGKAGPVLEAAGIVGILRYNAEACAKLINFLSAIISQEAGGGVADEFEKEARAFCEVNHCLTVAYCRDALHRHALSSGDAAALKKFVDQMPEALVSAVNLTALFPHCQMAVMRGVQKGVEMMRAVVELAELDKGVLKPGGYSLPLDSVKKTQKVLTKAIRDWLAAVIEALPAHSRERDLPLVKKSAFRIMLVLHAELAEQCLETLTTGPIGDIFTVQGAVVKDFSNFAKETELPSGFDGKGPDHMQRVMREYLCAAACRQIKKRSAAADLESIRAEAALLVRPNVHEAMARLLTLFLNDLLSDLPSEKELRPRANVKGFDAEGFHADFIRDCIAKRYSFTIEYYGKVENVLEREAAVGRGKKDLEFYTEQLEKMIRNGQEKEVKKWAPPVVRTSAAMTEKDLKAAQEFIMQGVKERDMRIAVTAIANQASLALFECFYGKEPATGVTFESGDKQMAINFTPRKGEFSIKAELHNHRMQSVERHGDGEEEIEFKWVNFFLLEYNGRLKREEDRSLPSGRRWRVCGVNVEVSAAHLLPPPPPVQSK